MTWIILENPVVFTSSSLILGRGAKDGLGCYLGPVRLDPCE